MAEEMATSDAGLEREEERLARAAAAGDGNAFATLYERYARRAYNLALRLSGSDEDAADAVQEAFLNVMRRLGEMESDRELAFGSYLFTATRNATYDLLRRQQRTGASDSIPESAVPLGAGAGGLGLDPGDPDEDPDRKVLLEAQQEEVAAANARLPERQREALALRELEEMSYDEIAAVMEMNRNSVAQLISRARMNLRDELRGSALASVAVSSADCERALPLIAARDDGQLAADSADAAWLSSHMSSCHTCQVASEAMQDAGVSYRAWIPVAVAPWLFKETMAKAAELSGGDWSEVIERRAGQASTPGQLPGMPAAYAAGRAAAEGEGGGTRRRRLALAGVLALLLLLGGAVAALSSGGGGEEPTPEPARFEVAEDAVLEPVAEPDPKAKPAPIDEEKQEQKKSKPTEAQAPADDPEPLPVTEASTPSAAPPAESKTKTQAPPASEPKGGEAGLGGNSTRDPQPETTPPAEQPPTQPPAGEAEEPPPPPPPPKPPKKGPGDFTSPPGPPKPG